MAQTNPPFLTGVPELLVLRMLSGREMYGYEIVKAMRLVTGEAIGFGEGVIYPVLHALEEGGALKARRSLCHCVTLSATGERFRAEGTLVTRLKVDGPAPQMADGDGPPGTVLPPE